MLPDPQDSDIQIPIDSTEDPEFIVAPQAHLYSDHAMRQVPVTWMGRTNLRTPTEIEELGVDPITQDLDARRLDKVHFVTDHTEAKMRPFVASLKGGSQAKFEVCHEALTGQPNFTEALDWKRAAEFPLPPPDDYTEKTWVERWMSVVAPVPRRGDARLGENCICL
jgi:hypothetical protein